ncbi:glutaredoxin 3 [archaeon]|jgi:glutaredoxin 3|nr:glutaredoxin 3 [archaeon]MBT6762519.1 glutaredoxin 3 [archaeon]
MKQVTIYTKDYCSFCKAAKNLLDSKGISFKEIDLQNANEETMSELSKKTDGYTMVPQIFIGDEFIGGFDQLSALAKSGKLDEKLKE